MDFQTVANVDNHICNKNQLKEFETLCFEFPVKNVCISIKPIRILQIFLNNRTDIFACLRYIGNACVFKINKKQ